MTRLTPNEVQIAWEETGDGPPILLIMGLGYARWAWEPIVPGLAMNHRVLTFDNRGIGESASPPGPYDARMMAEDAIGVLDAAGVEKASVVGSSLGGMVAQELAIEYPERVDNLVLMSTTPGGSDSYPMPGVTVDLMARAADMEPEQALRAFVANALSSSADPKMVDELVAARLASPQDPDAWAAQAAAGTGYDGSGRAAEIEAPTLIIRGVEDNVVDVRNSELLHDAIPDSLLVSIPGGHLLHWEHPGQCVAEILAFLDKEDS